MARVRDNRTLDMFEVPQPAGKAPASMDYRSVVAHMVAEMLKQAESDRYGVAAEMSRLTGREITKAMLDAYTSEAREAWNIPFWLAPALETACDSHMLSAWMADKRGARLMVGKEVLAAELGKLEQLRDEAAQKIRELKRIMGEIK